MGFRAALALGLIFSNSAHSQGMAEACQSLAGKPRLEYLALCPNETGQCVAEDQLESKKEELKAQNCTQIGRQTADQKDLIYCCPKEPPAVAQQSSGSGRVHTASAATGTAIH
jgi:hypothetical protein